MWCLGMAQPHAVVVHDLGYLPQVTSYQICDEFEARFQEYGYEAYLAEK